MSANMNSGEKSGPTAKDIGIIVGAILALAIAVFVVYRTVTANQIHDVIVIKGAKGAKPMGNDAQAPEADPSGGASDKPIRVQ